MGNKYYYIDLVYQSEYSSNNSQPELAKWNKNYYVELRENFEGWPYLSVTITKFKSDNFHKPQSDKYQKVKPIIEELFEDYYNNTLRTIYSTKLCKSEFYLIENSRDWYQIEYYSEDEKNKRKICIDFRNSIEDLWLMIYSNRGYSGRPQARKNGKPIKHEDFMMFFNLTMKFLSDHNSYQVYMDKYIKDFLKLVSGDKKIENFDLNANKAFKNIIDSLVKRKATIEKRLIENDKDNQEMRIKLRGELEGIKYAIKTVHIYK